MHKLTLTKNQFDVLSTHLLPYDGKEAVAIALCGAHSVEDSHRYFLNEIYLIPYEECSERTEISVSWNITALDPLLKKAIKRNWTILKIHSHREGSLATFSKTDDVSDKELYSYVGNICDSQTQLLSCIILEDKSIVGRVLNDSGIFEGIEQLAIVGDDIDITRSPQLLSSVQSEISTSHKQLFGDKTTEQLSGLKIGVIGCSGTGSFVIEQLFRLGIGELVLVDPDTIENRNLNRIVNAQISDAELKTPKVKVFENIISKSSNTKVQAMQMNIANIDCINQLADCDVLFGCVDTILGRVILNRMSAFYTIPYFDLGVYLEGNKEGGLQYLLGTSHYIYPGFTSLRTRGVYSQEDANADLLYFTSPTEYHARVKEGYIKDAVKNIESPSVISINALLSSLAINDFLARIHPYRYEDNRKYSTVRFDLINHDFFVEDDPYTKDELTKYLGWGDIKPILELSFLK